MEHAHHGHDHGHGGSPKRVAAVATLHCLTGCAIGEVLGMVIGAGFGLGNTATVVLSILLAFLFGYSLTMLPLVRAGLALAVVLPIALASDTFSIAVMEVVDNATILAIPGAMDAGLGDALFWGTLAFALGVAFLAAWPVNVFLIGRGQGHAVVHGLHGGGDAQPPTLRLGRLAAVGAAAIACTVAIGIAGSLLAG